MSAQSKSYILYAMASIGMASTLNAVDVTGQQFLEGNFTANDLNITDTYNPDRNKLGNARFDQVILKDLINNTTTINTNKPIYTYTDQNRNTNGRTSYSLMGNIQLGASAADMDKTLRFVISRDYNQSAKVNNSIIDNGLISNVINRGETHIRRFDVVVGTNLEIDASNKDNFNFIYIANPAKYPYTSAWQAAPNGAFISFGQNVKSIGMEGDSNFIYLQSEPQNQGPVNAIFLNHKGAQQSIDITKNYFGDNITSTICQTSTSGPGCVGNGYSRNTADGYNGGMGLGDFDANNIAINPWINSNAGRGFYSGYNGTLSGDSYNAFSMGTASQNTSLGKVLAISGDIYLNGGNNGVNTRLYANFEGANSHYYGDISGNGALYLAFSNGAKFKGNDIGSLSIVNGIEESNSTGSIKGDGYRNIYFGFTSGTHTLGDQFDINISDGSATSKYVIDNLSHTTTASGDPLSEVGINFDGNAKGEAWVVRSNIVINKDHNFTGGVGNSITKYVFGNEAYGGGDYESYIANGYDAYTLRKSDSNETNPLVSDVDIGTIDDNITKNVSFVFKDGTFTPQQRGYTGTISGGTNDSRYYIQNGGYINQSQIDAALGEVTLSKTKVVGWIIGNGNIFAKTYMDLRAVNTLKNNPFIVGNYADRFIDFDFTGSSNLKSDDINTTIFVAGAGPTATYSINNLGSIESAVSSTALDVIDNHGIADKNYTDSVLGVMANAGVVFDNIDSNITGLKKDTNIGATAQGTKFVFRGTSIDGNIVDQNFSLDMVFDTTTEDKGSTIYKSPIATSSYSGNNIDLTNNSNSQSLAFIGEGSWSGAGDKNITLGNNGTTTLLFDNANIQGLNINANTNVTLKLSAYNNSTDIALPGFSSANRLKAGSSIDILNSSFAGDIYTANTTTGTGIIKIRNTNSGRTTLGIIDNGGANSATSANRIILHVNQDGLLSTGTLKGSYEADTNALLNGQGVTTIALGKLHTANGNNANNTNHLELKSNNAGGIIELVQTDASGNYYRAGSTGSGIKYARLDSRSNIDIKGTSVVGDIVTRNGTYTRAIFASGDGAEAINSAASTDYVANSKYYGGVIVGAHNGGHGDVNSDFTYGVKDTDTQGYWFVGADSHNFKSGKVNANNTIVAFDGTNNNYKGWSTFRFVNADNIDGELFSNFGSNGDSINNANKQGNIFNLVGTSIQGDINATKQIATLGTWNKYANANQGTQWILNAIFDNRDDNATRGTTDAFGLITDTANNLSVAQSEMNGSIHLGNTAKANMTFRGLDSHYFTTAGGKSITGGSADSRFVFDDAFRGDDIDLKIFKDIKGEVVVLNTNVSSDLINAESSTSKFKAYFYTNGIHNGAESQKIADEVLNTYGVALDTTKDTSFSGKVGYSTQALNLTFVGAGSYGDIFSNYGSLDTDSNSTTLPNYQNQYRFVDVGVVNLSAVNKLYINIMEKNSSVSNTDLGQISLLGNSMAVYDNYDGIATDVASGSRVNISGTRDYTGADVSTLNAGNNLAYNRSVRYYSPSAKQDIELNFGGATRLEDGSDKMLGYILGGNNQSKYVFNNLGTTLLASTMLDGNKTAISYSDPYGEEINVTKSLESSKMSNLQIALINAGVKFYVDGSDINKSGTTIGLRSTALDINGTSLGSMANDNNFGYDMAFDDTFALNGDVNLTANTHNNALSFNGATSLKADANISLGEGNNTLTLSNTRGNLIKLLADKGSSASTYTFDNAQISNIDGAQNIITLNGDENASSTLNATNTDFSINEANVTAIKSTNAKDLINIINSKIVANGTTQATAIESNGTLNLINSSVSVASEGVATAIKVYEGNFTNTGSIDVVGGAGSSGLLFDNTSETGIFTINNQGSITSGENAILLNIANPNVIVTLNNTGTIDAKRDVKYQGYGTLNLGVYHTNLKDFQNDDAARPFEMSATSSINFDDTLVFRDIEFIDNDGFNLADMVSIDGNASIYSQTPDVNKSGGIVSASDGFKVDSMIDFVSYDFDKASGNINVNIDPNLAPSTLAGQFTTATIESQVVKMSSQVSAHLNQINNTKTAIQNSDAYQQNRRDRIRWRLSQATENYKQNKYNNSYAMSANIASDSYGNVYMNIPVVSKNVRSKDKYEAFLVPYYSKSTLRNGLYGNAIGSGFMVGMSVDVSKDSMIGLHAGMETRYGSNGVTKESLNSYTNVSSIMIGLHGRTNLLKYGGTHTASDNTLYLRGEASYVTGSTTQNTTMQDRNLFSNSKNNGFNALLLAGIDQSISLDKIISLELGASYQNTNIGASSLELGTTLYSPARVRHNIYGLGNLRYSQAFNVNSMYITPSIALGARGLINSAGTDYRLIVANREFIAGKEILQTWSGLLDVGVSMVHISNIFRFSLNYTGELGQYMTTHNIHGRIGLRF